MRRPMQGWCGGIAAILQLAILQWSMAASPAAGQGQEPFSISVDVNLVVLQASVHDRRGRDVLSLRQRDFALYEDDVRQTIRLFRREDAPVTVGLVVDHSGSMRGKLGDVTAAAKMFARSSNPRDEMFVVNFNEKVFHGLTGARQFTDQPRELEEAIARAPADGQTALYDAIAAGLERLGAGQWDKKVLVVISDGGDNASKVNTLVSITAMAERSNAVIYTVGIFEKNDPDANPGVLRRLAERSGGESFFPEEPGEMQGISEHIAHDIRSQYTIGYAPNNIKPDGAHRSIRLTAKAPGSGEKLRVRTRKGYVEDYVAERGTR